MLLKNQHFLTCTCYELSGLRGKKAWLCCLKQGLISVVPIWNIKNMAGWLICFYRKFNLEFTAFSFIWELIIQNWEHVNFSSNIFHWRAKHLSEFTFKHRQHFSCWAVVWRCDPEVKHVERWKVTWLWLLYSDFSADVWQSWFFTVAPKVTVLTLAL